MLGDRNPCPGQHQGRQRADILRMGAVAPCAGHIVYLPARDRVALGILPQAVVADIAEADRIKTGENREGMFYAARTFAFKLGQSVAMLIFTSLAKVGSDGLGYRLSA